MSEATEIEGLHGVGDYLPRAPESWDRDYAHLWAQWQAEQHNKLVYRRLWIAARGSASDGVPQVSIVAHEGSNGDTK